MTTVSPLRLAKVFVEVSDTLVDRFDLIEFLHMLTMRAAELAAADVVGLVLANQQGQLQFMAGSREEARLLELFQLQNDEGPCLDAIRTGVTVVETDLRSAGTRWPQFAPHATAAGFRYAYAFPLRLRAQVIGALNVFGVDDGRLLTDDDIPVVQALADLASIAILQERFMSRGEELTVQLQSALNSRVVIEQAKGAIAQHSGVSVDEAFILIRGYARSKNLRLVDVARTIVTDLAAIPEFARAGG
ncbi:GAF and ANTAR domain-containing protein [Micromonospora sp. NBC_01796]|uniref:GAF and ANTAR domain-containing protein n=1 Tax=Micromonospora sp. NBC_01796 TaxID=2975987 RepID=UPI002DDAC2F3|nr:GAF and ANTAR domain-containing protein [Micromonospora sp. NBC_01796]WSA83552.1 GAF and ANTAR domain-containing protein [Micromonospora sp. NBC_01796]